MRKFFLGIAATSLLFGVSSCMKETKETLEDGKDKISFKSALGKQTVSRAQEFLYWGNAGKLNVYAYPPNLATLFNKFELTYSAATSSWSYTPPVNQPGTLLRYYSVYPENTDTDVFAWGTSTATDRPFSYTVIADEENQEDLIATNITTNDSEVTLRFNHLLSQVNFAVQGMWGAKIEIEGLAVNDVVNTGTFSFVDAVADTDYNGWTLNTGEIDDYTYTPQADSLTVLEAGTTDRVVYLGNGGGKYDLGNALMLMPQEFAANSTSSLSFKFRLTIDDDNDGVIDDVATDLDNEYNDEGFVPINALLRIFETTEWLPGKRYVYLIDFSSYLEKGEITFKVLVNPWVDDDDNTTVETLHVPDASASSIESTIAKHAAANAANSNITAFPISVAYDLTSTTAVTITYISGFDQTDKIRIQFPSTASAQYFNVNVVGWTKTVDTEDGRVVILEWDGTNTMAVGAGNVNAADNTPTAIEAAIAVQSAANATTPANTLFSVTVPGEITGGNEVQVLFIPGFQAGDRLRLVFDSAADVADVTIAAAGWNVVGTYDNVVLIQCTTPTAAGTVAAIEAVTVAGDEPTAEEIEAAIAAQDAAKGATATLVWFPITLDKAATAAIAIDYTATDFATGDKIVISCPDNATAGHITLNGWTKETVVGTRAIFTK